MTFINSKTVWFLWFWVLKFINLNKNILPYIINNYCETKLIQASINMLQYDYIHIYTFLDNGYHIRCLYVALSERFCVT